MPAAVFTSVAVLDAPWTTVTNDNAPWAIVVYAEVWRQPANRNPATIDMVVEIDVTMVIVVNTQLRVVIIIVRNADPDPIRVAATQAQCGKAKYDDGREAQKFAAHGTWGLVIHCANLLNRETLFF